MALETVVNYYSQDPFSYYGFKDFYSLLGGGSNNNNIFGFVDPQPEFELDDKPSLFSGEVDHVHAIANNNNWEYYNHHLHEGGALLGGDHGNVDTTCINSNNNDDNDSSPARRKRRRARSGKNKEELETQRMTHIAVERNRRRQMNEYLAVLRSLMPPSYVHRGDQASIIGGAINFVKELEQMLQSMESHKTTNDENHDDAAAGHGGLAEFFTFPQYSTAGSSRSSCTTSSSSGSGDPAAKASSESRNPAVADIEVTMVDSHANLKIMAKKQPRLLLRIAAGLQALRLGILHLNVTTAQQMVLYSVSVKIEEGCQLNTVDEIASAVNQMLRRIQEEPTFT